MIRACILIQGLLSIGCVAGCADAPAATEPPVPKVTVQHPELRKLTDYDDYNGWTEASATVEVRSRVRGHVVKVHFQDGEFVKQGDPLFELDPRPFQAEVDRAKEQLKISQAQEYAADREEARQKALFDKKVVTLAELEKAQATLKVWEAQILAGNEEIKRRELELSYATITAPISGKISRAMLSEGNLVNAGGSDPLMTTIVAMDPIDVYFAVDERALLRYRDRHRQSDGGQHKPGKEASIPFEFGLETDDAFPHRGVLDFADNRIDPATGTIEVRGKVDNPEGRFIPGGRVRIRIAVSDPYDSVLVPDTAIQSDQDKKYVLMPNEKGVVVRRDIRPGKLLADGMRVTLPTGDDDSGLAPNDWVVVLGLQRARVNYPVDPMDREGNPLPKGAE